VKLLLLLLKIIDRVLKLNSDGLVNATFLLLLNRYLCYRIIVFRKFFVFKQSVHVLKSRFAGLTHINFHNDAVVPHPHDIPNLADEALSLLVNKLLLNSGGGKDGLGFLIFLNDIVRYAHA